MFALLILLIYLFAKKIKSVKLRLTHNSIRIRVQRSELTQLGETGTIQESVAFPTTTTFQYEITMHDGQDIEASYNGAKMSIKIPNEMAQSWIESTQVGIEAHLSLSGKDQLHVLIEKDFPCADRPNEDKSETFWELTDKPDPIC